jgi:hypothetical protein
MAVLELEINACARYDHKGDGYHGDDNGDDHNDGNSDAKKELRKISKKISQLITL